MEIKEIEVDDFITIKNGTRIVKNYISKDGRVFTKEKECIDWENKLDYDEKFSKIRKKFFSFNIYPLNILETWYFPINEEEVEMIKNHYGWNKKYNDLEFNENAVGKSSMPFVLNEWVGCYYEDGGDYNNKLHFYTLDFIKNDFNKFLKEFEK